MSRSSSQQGKRNSSEQLQIKPRAHVADTLRRLSKVPVDQDGRISWDITGLDEGTFTLIAGLEFPVSVGDHIKDGAIWHVLNECARKKDFSQQSFIRWLREFVDDHLSKPPKILVAISQVNCNSGMTMPKRLPSIEGPVEFKTSLSAAEQSVIAELPDYDRARLGLHTDFIYMTSDIKAPDDLSALNLAHSNMKYCLGALNLVCRGFGVSMRFGMPHAPIGGLLAASPIFMINRRQRKLGGYIAENHFPTSFKSSFTYRQRPDTERTARAYRPYISDLRGIDYREKMVQAIVLFQEGLETPHIDIALLKIWTALELLCSRETREPSANVIERASSIFTNPREVKIRLNFIQEFRNKVVHRGGGGGHAVVCAQRGSLYLATVIRFFLFNIHRFRTHSQILDYLDTPLDPARLREQIALYRKRLRAAEGKDLDA